jgi:hypothetical protein
MAYTTINKSTDYFNTVLYTGNGSNNHTITGVNFNTDLAWIKNRGGDDHRLFDKVRGVNKFVKSNTTDAETTDAIFTTNSDGYVVTNAGEVNANNQNFVGWNWKANGAGSANTDGDINSTVSVNTTAGFSIVKYTGTGSGATVGHGLGVKPSCMIIKRTNTTANWAIYHNKLNSGTNPEVKYLEFNTNGELDDAGIFNDTAPTSSVFTVGNSDKSNTSGSTYIAYCFAEKTGYSKFGSYTGNGSTNGTFVYTGFKPAFLIAKRINAASSWGMWDSKRDPINQMSKALFPNLSNAEGTDYYVDFLSNGFKWRLSGSGENGSGSTYIYMAFGQTLVGSNNIPATAR